MFDIKDVSAEENDIITRAKEQYGLLFDTAMDAVNLSWTLPKVAHPDAWIFAGFLSQSNNALYLCLLSTLRKHAAQANFNARLSLEASIMACYSLRTPDIDVFVERNSSGESRVKQKAKSKAYDWIDKHYKTHSERLKKMKSEINETFAHSNIISAFGHSELSEESRRFNSWFFDLTPDRDVHFQLLKFIGLVLAEVTMYKDVVKDYPLIQFRDGFEVDYEKALAMYAALSEFYQVVAQEIEKGNIEEIPTFQIMQDEG